MSEQISRHRCLECGQTFEDAAAFSNHVKTHQIASPAEEQDLSQAYAHADREFSRARVPIFGITLLFLVALALSLATGVGLFAPLFVAAVGSTIVALSFLFKFLMEG